jgi:hypothetical protein
MSTGGVDSLDTSKTNFSTPRIRGRTLDHAAQRTKRPSVHRNVRHNDIPTILNKINVLAQFSLRGGSSRRTLFPPIRGWEGKTNMNTLIEAQEGAPPQKFDPLENRTIYRIRFPDFNGPGKDEFMDILHDCGFWCSPNDGDMGPARVEQVEYEVVARVGRQKPVRRVGPAPCLFIHSTEDLAATNPGDEG